MENSRPVIPLFGLLAITVITLLLLNKPEKIQQDQIISVRTATLSDEAPIKRVQISGTTQSAETAVLRFQVGGRVTTKTARLGDVINKGDSLATLYNPELEPITAVAKDNFARLSTQTDQAQRDFNRINELYKDQAVTVAEWESARTALSASKNAQSAAKSELGRAAQVSNELSLVAPFSGSVTEIMIDVGEVVSAGSAAVRLSNAELVELKVAVSDRLLQQISLGQNVLVQRALEPTQAPLQGVVSEISPHRERGSLPEIIISLNAEHIGPGVAVNASIEIQEKKGLSIPMRSVLMTGDNTVAVYRVVDQRAVLVPIRPLRIDTQSVVIEQGLSAGDAIVVEGLSQLYDGARVTQASAALTTPKPE